MCSKLLFTELEYCLEYQNSFNNFLSGCYVQSFAGEIAWEEFHEFAEKTVGGNKRGLPF